MLLPGRNREDREYARKTAGLFFVPLLWIACPVTGYFIGHFLDKWFKTDETMTIVFLVLGIIAAGRETWLITSKLLKEKE